jgi:hypothetical protein
MRYATVDEGVDPRKQLVFIVLHGVFNILGAVGFLGLFILSVISQRLRKNVVLLSFFAVFPLVNVANTLLLWTGYIFKPVPFGLCVASGALGSSSSLLQVAAALALVLKVWTFNIYRGYNVLQYLGMVTYSHGSLATFNSTSASLIVIYCESSTCTTR